MDPVKEMTRGELEEEVKWLRVRCSDLEKIYNILSETLKGWLGETTYNLVKPYIDRLLAEVKAK